MSESRTRLLVTDQAALAPEILERFSSNGGYQRLPSPATISLDGSRLLLVLTPDQAEAMLRREDLQSRPISNLLAIVLWRSDSGQPVNGALLDHPLVVGVLDQSCPADTVYATLRSGVALLERTDDSKAAHMLERVLDIGRALASEKDLDTLLDLILTHARELTNADGASIYTKDSGGKLYFRLWQNFSKTARSNAQKTLISEKYSIAGYVARTGEVIAVDDAYAIPDSAPYRFSPASDRSIGYRTRSMLTVPLKNKVDDVVGVLQLINRKDRADALLETSQDVVQHVLPFDELSRSVALALSGQAGVALENGMLYRDIERLFEGFIKASVQAIEARDPTTAGHSERVADYTDNLAQAVDRADGHGLRDILFSRDELTELRYAALLHDFGKVGVREHVLQKAKKLYSHELEIIKQRFQYAGASIAREEYRRLIDSHQQLSPDEFAVRRDEVEKMLASEDRRLQEFLQIVLRLNEPNVSQEMIPDDLDAVARYTFTGNQGERLPLLRPFELDDLRLAKGSLNPDQMKDIQSHVRHTFEFLKVIPWTKKLENLPKIAYAHHEKLDGSGYPQGLTSVDIPVQAKIMTIADIYDALTAGDRPYKPGMAEDKALDELHALAAAGQIDADLLKVFVESQAYVQTR